MSDPRTRAGTAHHVSFCVVDLERSLTFYEGLLGCGRIDRPSLGVPGAWLTAGTTQVHLIEDPEVASRHGGESGIRGNHVAFHTDDLDAAEAGFVAAGIEVTRGGTLPQFFVRDPDGNLLEFTPFEPPSATAASPGP